jgi:hypothetical protein
MVASAAESEGKKFIGKLGDAFIKKHFPETEDVLTALKKEKDILSLKKDIDDLKNPKEKELSWEEKTKKYNLEKQMEKDAQAKKDMEDTAKREAFDETVDTMNSTARNSKNNTKSKTSAKTMYDNTKKSTDGGSDEDKTETFTPGPDDISGPGSSGRTSGSSGTKKSSDYYDPITVDFVDKTANTSTNVAVRSNSDVSTGKSFTSNYLDMPISGLLGSPKDRD